MSRDGLPRIHVLPASLSNQIAAGEVVERPSSVVKELVENSLDAGARRIDIEAAGAGIEFIRVRDDGHGIHPHDLELALERHATSKLREPSDLEAIRSLGFRGEALPSIASVAGLRITSRDAAHDTGRRLETDPLTGRRLAGPAAHPVGTTVEVTGLFRGVPARRKFLRSERTEYLHLLDAVRRLALSPLSGIIRFSHDGQSVLEAGGGPEDRIGGVLGRGFVRMTLPIDCAAGPLRLHGRIGRPEAHRSQSDQQYLYLNGRVIRDRQINHAIRLAYGDAVPAGRFPLFLLYLEMDAAAADVNVHPTKHEVRFRQARDVHDFVYAGIRGALAESGLRTAGGAPESVAREPGGDYRAQNPAPQAPRLGQPLAQLAGRFVLTERESACVLIDARALTQEQSRIRLRRPLDLGEPLRKRPLLVPVYVEGEPGAAEMLERHADLLDCFGIELDCIAPNRIAVRAIPALLGDADAAALGAAVMARLRGKCAAADIAELLPELLPDRPCAGMDIAALTAMLRGFEQQDLDFSAASAPGFWRTLGAEDFSRLLGKHGHGC